MAGVAFKIHFYSICFYYSVHWTIWQAILFSHFRLLRVCNNKRNKKHWTDVGITFCDLLQLLYFCVWFYLIIDFLSFLRPLHGKEIDFSTDVTVKLIANENFIYFCYILLGKKIVEIQNDGWAMNGGRENSDEHLKYCRRAAASRKIDRGCHVVSVSIYILRLLRDWRLSLLLQQLATFYI